MIAIIPASDSPTSSQEGCRSSICDVQRSGHSGESEDDRGDALKTDLRKQVNDKTVRWIENLGDDFKLFNRDLVNLVQQVDAGYVVPERRIYKNQILEFLNFETETCLFPSTTSMRSSTVASQRRVMSALEILRG